MPEIFGVGCKYYQWKMSVLFAPTLKTFSARAFFRHKKRLAFSCKPLIQLVGTIGFEPTTPTPPVWCATKLRYAPTIKLIILFANNEYLLAKE